MTEPTGPSAPPMEANEAGELDDAVALDKERIALRFALIASDAVEVDKTIKLAAELTYLPEVLADLDIVALAELKFLRVLNRGDWDSCTKLADVFFVNQSTLFFHSPEIHKAAENGVLPGFL